MQSGALGTIEATKLATGAEDEIRLEIHGSRGAIRFNGMEPHHLGWHDATAADEPLGGLRGWNRIDAGGRYPRRPRGFPRPKAATGWIESHVACLANFLRAVADGQPAEPSLRQGVHVQHLMDCLRRSAAAGALGERLGHGTGWLLFPIRRAGLVAPEPPANHLDQRRIAGGGGHGQGLMGGRDRLGKSAQLGVGGSQQIEGARFLPFGKSDRLTIALDGRIELACAGPSRCRDYSGPSRGRARLPPPDDSSRSPHRRAPGRPRSRPGCCGPRHSRDRSLTRRSIAVGGRVEPPLFRHLLAEVVMGLGIVGVNGDRRSKMSDGRLVFTGWPSRLPRLLWATAFHDVHSRARVQSVSESRQ